MISTKNFSEFNISVDLIGNLQAIKILQPTEVQAEIIPKVFAGSDGFFIAPTGTGKTLAYLLPVVTKLISHPEARALVLVPTREVADQINKVLTTVLGKIAFKTAIVVGGPLMKEQSSALKKNPRIIIATPGRLQEHLKTNKLLLQSVKFMIVDEADRMLEMGFLPQIESIRKTMRGDWQTILLSATGSDRYQKEAAKFLKPSNANLDLRNSSVLNTKLRQKIYFVEATKKRELVLKLVQEYEGRILIFSYDQYVCEDVDKHLRDNGVSCDAIHGKQSSQQRIAIINNFRSGKYRVLVTTDLLARGLDIPDIECVINFDLPTEAENFVHRVGRTARAGASGTAISLVAKIDLDKMPALEKYLACAEQLRF